MDRIRWRYIILALATVVLGWFIGQAMQNSRSARQKQQMHAALATIRTFEEGFALRHGHYLMLSDSCATAGHAEWKQLGMAPPAHGIGCFHVESLPLFAQAQTAPAMRIVAISPALGLKAVETSDDSQPTWSPAP